MRHPNAVPSTSAIPKHTPVGPAASLRSALNAAASRAAAPCATNKATVLRASITPAPATPTPSAPTSRTPAQKEDDKSFGISERAFEPLAHCGRFGFANPNAAMVHVYECVWMHVCMYVCVSECVCVRVCVHVCMYVCMHV